MNIRIKVLQDIQFQAVNRLGALKKDEIHLITEEENKRIKRFENIYFSYHEERKVEETVEEVKEVFRKKGKKIKKKCINYG